MRFGAALAALLLALFITACAGALRWAPESYTVKEGDTLYSIAFRHGIDYRELAAWNGIGAGYLIYPGDELILQDPGRRPAASGERTAAASTTGTGGSRPSAGSQPGSEGRNDSRPTQPPRRRTDLNWVWPVEGELINRFGDGAMGKGIQIAAEEGSNVMAAGPGRVVYTGSGLIGYGKLIIIKHDDVFLSAYGHNQEILVDEGDEVQAGDRIGRVGLGRGNRSMLHFEIRSEGNAVDPMQHLPARR